MFHNSAYLCKEGIISIERLPSLIGNTTHNQEFKYLRRGAAQEINHPIGPALLVYNHLMKLLNVNDPL
jgi:hypothetical protein